MKSDPIAQALKDISDKFEALGGEGRLAMVLDIPVMIIVDGEKFQTSVCVRWSEDGVEVVDPEKQARCITREVREWLDGR